MRAIKLSEKKYKAIIETVMELINSITNENVKKKKKKMMDEMGDRYFEAPASNKLEYHSCFVGGLAEHSLRVFGNLSKLCHLFAKDISKDTIILVSLMHDLGKLGTREEPYYIDQDSDWHKVNRGEMWKHNLELEFLGVAQRSLRLLEQFDVPMTESEYKSILIHDGQYVEANRQYAHKEGMLGLLLHQADIIATKQEKDKWESVQ